MPMVRYWKTAEKVAGKIVQSQDGYYQMYMEGEDYPFPGYPRGHSLFGTISKLKHEIKNQIFNESWAKLEAGETIADHIKQKITKDLQEFMDKCRYDMLPYEKMQPPIRELWRVLTKMEQKEPQLKLLKEMLCFIMQEDDAYRFRMQWLFGIFRPRWWLFWIKPIKLLEVALKELVEAEVIGDMKERQRLLGRVLLEVLKDKKVKQLFDEFCKEINWKKLQLTKGDKYHFRGKYFKVDWDKFEY